MAARIRILERGPRQSGDYDLPAVIIATARHAHELIDRSCERHHHGLGAAIRSATVCSRISKALGQRLHRLAASALRHCTPFSLDKLVEDLLIELGGEHVVCSDGGCAPSVRSADSPRDVKHALGLAELACRGLDLVLSREVSALPVPNTAVVHHIGGSTHSDGDDGDGSLLLGAFGGDLNFPVPAASPGSATGGTDVHGEAAAPASPTRNVQGYTHMDNENGDAGVLLGGVGGDLNYPVSAARPGSATGRIEVHGEAVTPTSPTRFIDREDADADVLLGDVGGDYCDQIPEGNQSQDSYTVEKVAEHTEVVLPHPRQVLEPEQEDNQSHERLVGLVRADFPVSGGTAIGLDRPASTQRAGVVGLIDAEIQQQFSALRLSDVSAAHSLLFKRFDTRLRKFERYRPGPSLTWDQVDSIGCHGVGYTPWYEALCDRYRGGTRDPRSMCEGLAQVVADVARFVSEANACRPLG